MSRFGFENQRSAICKVVLAVTVILSVFLIVACKQEPEVPEVELGSIVGHVFYSNGEDHSGIVLTLDKTDGLRAITNNDGARAIVSMAESNEDGSFAFHNLEPGTYTIYASSNDSVEKAVSTNVAVKGEDTVTAADLLLTATGSISGNVILDGSKTGNLGFLVFLAGTSYMAVTDDSGYYCISNVPAGEDYQLIVSKGGYTSSTVKSCSVKAHTRTSMSELALLSDDILSGSRSLVWKGSHPTAPADPKLFWGYFDTTDGCSYIFDGTKWTLLAAKGEQGDTGAAGAAGEDGASIIWLGSYASEPQNPARLNAYYNTETGSSYIFDGTKWTLLAVKGDTGATGAQGKQGDTGAAGEDGASIVWRGEFGDASEIENVAALNAYFNTTDGRSYIFDGTKWNILATYVHRYRITFAPNGGSGEMQDIIITSLQESASLPKGTFTGANGAQFVGWNTKADYTGDIYTDTDTITPSEDITLYAQWVPEDTFTVSEGVLQRGSGFDKTALPAKLAVPAYIGDAEVTGIGSEVFYTCFNLTDISIPSTVTSIGAGAFSYCSSLESITIPSGVTSIGESAFQNCGSLASITIPSGVTSIGSLAFLGCNGFTSIIIPDSVTSIGDYAFSVCTSLKSITFPSSVTSIGENAFYGCEKLESITIPSSVTSIGEKAFHGCHPSEFINNSEITVDFEFTSEAYRKFGSPADLIVPAHFTSIKDGTFFFCDSLESVAFEEGSKLTSIGENVFSCSSLESITIPSSVASIGDSAFSGCEKLESITIPRGVTSIEECTFQYCSGLTAITIPDTVTSIGRYAFSGCSGLKAIALPDSVSSIGGYAFEDCSKLESITIPAAVESLDDWTFANCSKLATVTFKEESQLTEIGYYTFGACSGLESITIPSSVTSIADGAFNSCYPSEFVNKSQVSLNYEFSELNLEELQTLAGKAITELTISPLYSTINGYTFSGNTDLIRVNIPASVETIGNGAFKDCSNLKTVFFSEGSKLTTIGSSAFRGCTSLESITVPDEVTAMKDWAFGGCISLASVALSKKLTKIPNYCFYGCTGLESITIPSSVTTIYGQAFQGCSSLQSVTFGENSSLTAIASQAFEGCVSISGIIIPNGVTSIGGNGFNNCSGLICVTLPESVNTLGASLFSNCSNLESLNYSGTTEQWGSINKGTGWKYKTKLTVVHASDGDINL